MTNRRRLLLSYLANSFKYLPYSYEYLYYGLVPNTIDSKQVRNKAKVSKLYGNSVVENQYIPTNQNTETKNGITFTNNGDGSWTISGTASADTSKKCGAMFLTQNHKYLLKGCKNGSSTTYYLQDENVNSSKEYGSGNIYTYSYTWSTNICIYVKSGTVISTPITIFPQLIDLTQQYPFNTPTTLTDNRVQAILNRGYIPYNLGELKSVDIGEISSYVYPPQLVGASSLLGIQNISRTYGNNVANVSFYPLTDNGFGIYAGSGTQTKPINRQANHKYFIYAKVDVSTYSWSYFGIWDTYSSGYEGNRAIPTKSGNDMYCIISPTTSASSGVSVFQFGGTNNTNLTIYNAIILDLTDLGLDSLTGSQVLEVIKKDNIIDKLANGEILNDTLQTIPFKYQGSGVGTAHDTYELTKTSHVFTKNMSRVDLGTIDYTLSSNCFYSTNANQLNKPLTLNFYYLQPKYLPIYNRDVSIGNMYADHGDKKIGFNSANGRIYITDTTYTNTTTFKTAMSGVMLEYQLATPQTISIPRKHLGVVKIRDLSWFLYSTGIYFAQIPNLKLVNGASLVGNITTSKYLTTSIANLFSTDNVIACGNNESQVYVKDTSINNTTDFLNKYGDYLIYYETESEVADITDTFDIESGGTINTDSNVLPNADFLMKCK